MAASSQASMELSTASLTVVSSALRGLSNPSKCRFLAKNSLTEMSRCEAAIDSAVARLRATGLPFLLTVVVLPEGKRLATLTLRFTFFLTRFFAPRCVLTTR